MPVMTKEKIFELIRENLLELLPELEGVSIDPQQSMKELGANSIDRVDVILQTMEAMSIKFPLSDLRKLENIQGLIDFLYDRCETVDV
ncbi:MAG: acyl carrier protein [Bacteroidetes bacterium]|nr:acyl carrier protein [Bacteroidota bacterium]